MELPADEGMNLIQQAFSMREEQKAWELYAQVYPWFTADNYISFDVFYNRRPTRKAEKAETGIKNANNVIDLLEHCRKEEVNGNI